MDTKNLSKEYILGIFLILGPELLASVHILPPQSPSRGEKILEWIGVREEYTAGALTNAKLVQGPRSGPMVAARFCIVQAPTSNDRELPNTTRKNGDLLVTNHKRTLSTCSSSSPVTQRADRRPQKISRSVRRTNIVPVVPSNDDITSLDSGTENGSGFVKQVLGSIQSVVPTPKPDLDSSRDIMLYQRILSALISKEGKDNENDDTESNGYGSTFEDETSLKSNGFMEFSGVGPFYGYGKNTARGFHNEPMCSVSDYQTMSMDNRLLMEI
nr:hypothetical protein [Tanacetum cinerariifolium]